MKVVLNSENLDRLQEILGNFPISTSSQVDKLVALLNENVVKDEEKAEGEPDLVVANED